MKDCLFCKIIRKEVEAEVIYEDENNEAVLDILPCAPGHALVLPRVHAGNILELEDDKLGPLFTAVKKVAALLKKKLNPDGFTIGINHGSISGQSVDHLHIHVIPRYEGDSGGSIHSVVRMSETQAQSIKDTAKKIKE